MSPPEGKDGDIPSEQLYDSIVSRLAQQDKTPWYQKPNLRVLYLIMFPTCLGVEMTSGFDASMLNGLQAVESWVDFYNHPRSALLGVMSAMYSLGAIVAVPLVPYVTDTMGRRRAIVFGSVLMIIGAVLQAAAQNLAMFIIARFILGLGIVFAIVAASSLIGELSHPKERAILGSLFNSCYFIGSIVAAGVTLGTFAIPNNWAWRIPSTLQIVPSLLQISFIWFLPESPRWLISKGRGDEAYAILVKYHAEGDVGSEFVRAEFAQIEKTLEVEMRNAKMSWREVLSTPGMRKRVIICSFLGLFTQWSGNGLTSHFLAPILDNIGIHDNRTKNLINLAMTCWSFVNATFLALTASRFPRRVMYMACTISLLVIFTAWTISSAEYARTGSKASSRAVLAFIFLYSPAYNLAYNALTYTFLVELFPFHVRARGITIFQWWGRAAGFFNQFVNPIGINNAGWKYYISYCIWLAFEVIFVYFMFPETSKRTLEELTFLYEGGERKEQVKRVEREIQNDAVPGSGNLDNKEALKATSSHIEHA
ncbi:general substrate transporter [Leucogyrophana mollusca]|uniref:General substrate transporter n=1 Tax=Leucogyrophana mollusca TaxID=85980 RepID=A0ACB8BPJ1_9AGAM|nr:general substrate transporter [Leucogyrophana mollusca]